MFESPACVLLLLLSVSAPSSSSSPPTREEYVVYHELELQLVSGKDASFRLYRLSEVFYPKVGPSPICVPLTYTLTCSNATVIENCTSDPIPCSETEADSFNASYLWSHYDLATAIGPVLLSYAWTGIRLRGFAWEDSCNIDHELQLVLDISNIYCRSGEVIKWALKSLTVMAKSYAKNKSSGGSPVHSETKGFALYWSHSDKETYIFHASHYTLIVMMAILNIFVFLTASAMATFTYNAVYESILHKKNPYYPLFWSSVLLALIWNLGPSWLVLSGKSELVYYSLAVMVPLEGLVAFFIKKKSNFPIPLLSSRGCAKHVGYFFIFDRTIIKGCIYCIISHVAQTLAIWILLVFVTFLAYYMAAIIIAFYLHPTQVLVKVVFLKAVAVSTVINVALLFSNSKFKCDCNLRTLEHDLGYVVRVIAIAAFLPILAFLAFVIGGILFNGTEKVSELQRILTLLPSLLLVFAAWFTKGSLFPVGTDEADLGSEVIHELEGGGGSGGDGGGHKSAETTPTSKTTYSSTGTTAMPRKPSSPINSLAAKSQSTAGNGQESEGANEEKKPLLL